jgi:dTDP-4-dehydrorhamnose reductase
MKVIVLGKGKLGGEIVKQTGWDYLCRAEHEITIDNFDEWKNKMDGYDVVVNCIANTDTYSDNKDIFQQTIFIRIQSMMQQKKMNHCLNILGICLQNYLPMNI